jgi:altronate dehydratase small subunit
LTRRKAIATHEDDNVASALTALGRGEVVEVEIGGSLFEVEVLSDVPFGHKFALMDIPRGGNVVKYGEVIGRATRDIARGEHVHVHNVESLRARGDLRPHRQSQNLT